MKNSLLIIGLISIGLWIISCNPKNSIVSEETSNFDSTLAIAYGADDYGMKKYVMAFLYRGENQTIDADSSQALQMLHLKNIERMAEEGKLVLAGPFFGDGTLRGIYIFNVSSIAEAESLTYTDPAIQAGVLRMELKEWYGSAALMGVNEAHLRIAKKSVVE